MHNEDNQGGPQEEKNSEQSNNPIEPVENKGDGSFGWLWIVGIIVAVAVVLFFLQSNVPEDSVVDEDEVADEIAVDPLRLRDAGVYDLATPSNVAPESIVGLDWIVSAAEAATADSTAIYWGMESLADAEFDADTTPDNTYPGTEAGDLSGDIAIPAKFEANIQVPKSGTVYLRAHAVIDGVNYWRGEEAINIENK